jgi:hypothetical protein
MQMTVTKDSRSLCRSLQMFLSRESRMNIFLAALQKKIESLENAFLARDMNDLGDGHAT